MTTRELAEAIARNVLEATSNVETIDPLTLDVGTRAVVRTLRVTVTSHWLIRTIEADDGAIRTYVALDETPARRNVGGGG